jgi:hypothetical protein
MKPEPIISDIKFIPVKPSRSHIGFVSFLYDGNIAVRDVAVHKKFPSGLRLVYPDNPVSNRPIIFPINKETQMLIDGEIELYLKVQGIT